MFVANQVERFAFALRNADGDQFLIKQAQFLSAGGALLAAQCKGVLIGAADGEFASHIFGGFRHGFDTELSAHLRVDKAPSHRRIFHFQRSAEGAVRFAGDKGARDMLSTPPAMMTSASPHLMARAAIPTASNPEPHRRLRVVPGTECGNPASSSAIRATLRLSSPAWLAHPRITSSMAWDPAAAVWQAAPSGAGRPNRRRAARIMRRRNGQRAYERHRRLKPVAWRFPQAGIRSDCSKRIGVNACSASKVSPGHSSSTRGPSGVISMIAISE